MIYFAKPRSLKERININEIYDKEDLCYTGIHDNMGSLSSHVVFTYDYYKAQEVEKGKYKVISEIGYKDIIGSDISDKQKQILLEVFYRRYRGKEEIDSYIEENVGKLDIQSIKDFLLIRCLCERQSAILNRELMNRDLTIKDIASLIKRETICWSPRVVLERVFLCIDKEEDAIESVLGIMQIYSSRLIELPVDINKVLSIVEKNDKEGELYFAFMRVCPMYRTEYLVEQIKNKALRFNNPKYCLEVLFEFNNPYIFDLNGVSNIVIDILSHEKNDNIKMSLIPVNAILKNASNEKKSIFMDFVMVHNDYRTLTSIFLNYEELNICRYRKMDLFKIILNHESSVSSYPRVVDLIPYEDDEKYFKCFLDYINNMENFKEVYIDNTKLFFSDRMDNIYLEKLSSADIKPGSNAFMLKEAIEKNKMENDKKASRIRNYR